MLASVWILFLGWKVKVPHCWLADRGKQVPSGSFIQRVRQKCCIAAFNTVHGCRVRAAWSPKRREEAILPPSTPWTNRIWNEEPGITRRGTGKKLTSSFEFWGCPEALNKHRFLHYKYEQAWTPDWRRKMGIGDGGKTHQLITNKSDAIRNL